MHLRDVSDPTCSEERRGHWGHCARIAPPRSFRRRFDLGSRQRKSEGHLPAQLERDLKAAVLHGALLRLN